MFVLTDALLPVAKWRGAPLTIVRWLSAENGNQGMGSDDVRKVLHRRRVHCVAGEVGANLARCTEQPNSTTIHAGAV